MILARVVSRVVLFCRRHRHAQVFWHIAACAVLVSAFSSPVLAANTIVRIEVAYGTTPGTIDVELYDDEFPITVANFLRYAGRGYYTTYLNSDYFDLPFNGFFHFSQPGFAIRAGGFSYTEAFGDPEYLAIPKDPPIPNESSPSRPNDRGTFAMFNPTDNPNGITSQWLINLANNTASINVVFGRVIAGMNVADDIGRLEIRNSTATGFEQLPVVDYDPTSGPIGPSNFVKVTRIPNVAGTRVPAGGWAIFTADKDMVFDVLGTVDPTIAAIWITAFKSPPGNAVHFNNNLIALLLSGPTGPAARSVTMHDGAAVRPTHYYAYGPTPDDPSDHWYDFAYDGLTGTGAEIKNDRIVLHFVDGGRGDNDRTVNGEIDHTGGQAIVAPIASPQSSGCSITKAPSGAPRGGEWLLIAAFLVLLAIRRRIHRNQLQ